MSYKAVRDCPVSNGRRVELVRSGRTLASLAHKPNSKFDLRWSDEPNNS